MVRWNNWVGEAAGHRHGLMTKESMKKRKNIETYKIWLRLGLWRKRMKRLRRRLESWKKNWKKSKEQPK